MSEMKIGGRLTHYANKRLTKRKRNLMEIQLVGIEGQPTFTKVSDLLVAAPALGLTQTGVETAPHVAAELQGLPKFKELVDNT